MVYWENELSFWIWLIPDDEFIISSKTLRCKLGFQYHQNINFPLHLTIGKLTKIEINTISDINHINSKMNKSKFQFISRIQPNDYFNSFVYVPQDKNKFNGWVKEILSITNIKYEREFDPHISLSYGIIKNNLLELKEKLQIKMSHFAIAVVDEKKNLWQIIYPK